MTKQLPEQIVIYRDGMGGPSMTAKVQSFEVKVITDMLENTTQGYKPKIIYCLIERNNNQRFFTKKDRECLNPGPGTVVDTDIVEYQGDFLYDFYLISHVVTVGTVKPVLYRVAYNTSTLSKNDFETGTYHLCHGYYNYAGAIKVPMVCMYARKICTYA